MFPESLVSHLDVPLKSYQLPVPEQVSDDDMVLMAREISKRIQEELQYPGQIKVNVIRESRVTEYAK